MWLSYTFSLIAAGSAIVSATTICTASQCIDGNGEAIVSVSGSLVSSSSPSKSNTLLLPDQYSANSPPNVVSLLTSGQSSISLPTYLGSSASSSGLISGLPFTIDIQPGLVVFPSSSFAGQPIVSSLNITGNATAMQNLKTGSFILSNNAYAVFASSNLNPVVFWDVTPDVGQLPNGLLNTQNGEVILIEVESTTCATPCAVSGRCTSQGTCVCKPGFTGSSCEVCSSGFYGPQCLACPAGCSACDEGITGSGKCLSPISSISPSTCDCDNGTCAGGSNGTCACVPGWTSVALTNSTVTSNTTASASSTQCTNCATGFFKDSSNDCRSCTLNCAACAGPTGACTQCRQGFTVNPNDATQCIASASGAATCADGSFPVGNGTCGTCSPLCKTCTGPTVSECLICGSGSSNLNGVCTSVDSTGVCTGTGLVVDNAKGRCDACPAKCSSCSIPNFTILTSFDTVQCNACLPGYVLSGGRCASECPVGQFVGADGVDCQKCDSSCTTCVGSSTFCLTCSQSGQFALNGTCTASCPASTFALATSVTSTTNTTSNTTAAATTGNTCSSCHPDCATCSGPQFDQCSSCPVDRPVKTSSGRCLRTCGRALFWDDVSGSCQQCPGGCASCVSGAADQCLSCAAGMVLSNGQCVTNTCSSGAVASLGGICLSTFVGATVSPSSTSHKVWPFIVMGVILLLLVVAGLVLWRWNARKRRALETKLFKERLERDGIAIGKRTSLWAWGGRVFKRRGGEDPSEQRRRKLREQMGFSMGPAGGVGMDTNADLVDVDLEGREGTGRVAEWRSKMSSSHSLPKPHSLFARLSSGTALTTESDLAPEQPLAQHRLQLRASRTDPGLLGPPVPPGRAPPADTSSLYSDSTSRSIGRTATIPTPRQPLKDTDLGITAPIQPQTTSIRYPPPRTTAGMSDLMQFQPLIDADPRPQPLHTPHLGANATGGASWQIPMGTGSSTGNSAAASKLGDKNPFRQRI